MRRSALLAACLVALTAIASCTSEGLAPPADIGSGASAATEPGMVALAPGPSATSPGVDAGAPAPQPAGAIAAPGFTGPEPSSILPQGDAAPVTAVLSGSRVQFAPITGATREAAVPLSQRLASRARERSITLAGNGATATHIMKGYFSEVSDGTTTTVIYVWDVLDPAGKRLHRIQGQARAEGSGGWATVPASAMQGIAERTIDALAQWLASRAG